MKPPRRQNSARPVWPELLLTLGLGATIASVGGVAAELVKAQGIESAQKCTLAAEMLHDDRLNSYTDERMRREVAKLATRRFMQCVRD